jgi:hypothetical protein
MLMYGEVSEDHAGVLGRPIWWKSVKYRVGLRSLNVRMCNMRGDGAVTGN